MIQKYVENLLETSTVKDKDGYSLGFYNDKKAVCGCYLKAKKGSVLERVEYMAKKKFNLEKDPENYAQEARAMFFIKLGDYLEEYGEPQTQQEVDKMNAFLFTSCKNYMADLARQIKGSSVYYDSTDKENQFKIVQSFSLDIENDFTQMLQGQVEKKLEEKEQKSYSIFKKWLDENKKILLTKKQLEYLKNEHTIDISNRCKINKTISERVLPHYNKVSVQLAKIKQIENKMEILEEQIFHKKIYGNFNFITFFIKEIKKESWLFEIVEDELPCSSRKIFLNIYNNPLLISFYWRHQQKGFEDIIEEIYEIIEKINKKFFTQKNQVKTSIENIQR